MRSIMARADALKATNQAEVRDAGLPRGASLDTRILFAGRSEVVILHGAEAYRLRLTRQNKLILTK